MPPRHTANDWRELVNKLTALRDNPYADREKRNKAETILSGIRANPEARAALAEVPITDQAPGAMGWDEMV